MKKVISLILALAMVASLLCTAVFAEGSKSRLFELIRSEAEEVELAYEVSETEEEEPAEEAVEAALNAALEAATAEDAEENPSIDVELLKTLSFDQLTLALMEDYTAEQFPCTLTFYGEGTEEVPVVVLVKYAQEEDAEEDAVWTLIYVGMGGEFSGVAEAEGTYAIYVVAE